LGLLGKLGEQAALGSGEAVSLAELAEQQLGIIRRPATFAQRSETSQEPEGDDGGDGGGDHQEDFGQVYFCALAAEFAAHLAEQRFAVGEEEGEDRKSEISIIRRCHAVCRSERNRKFRMTKSE
jgi:hypothetical protein